ncbi:MAG: tRNA uridine-5-carboxymethylaminomethyl(34) synthesis GTPase MnmE, partial [Clostridiales bacterium]|nr:tRNA uridine-5-carboxymethylaminomethyl(34) synthesis GTPase MnmE [Clostridiales bacterium]
MKNDLIAAIATAPGQAGIAVVRISGDNALDVLQKIFSHSGDYETHKLYYGTIKNEGNIIDYAMVAFMKAPHTYTGDDTIEVFCHGGYAVSRSVLSTVLEKGCRMAKAGEFTKRAFLNGRLDLSQAEAVSELIAANAQRAADVALNALSGRIKKQIDNMREKLLDFLAKIEVCIDYPEDDVEQQTAKMLLPEIQIMINDLETLLQTAHRGRIYKEGLTVAIAGRPNVGKSSLLNAIMGESRAIVTTTPGTTRDTLEAHVDINGLEVMLIDTAGIRKSDETIEKMGIERAENVIARADIVLLVIDNNTGITQEDIKVFQKLADKPYIVVINKMDIGSP